VYYVRSFVDFPNRNEQGSERDDYDTVRVRSSRDAETVFSPETLKLRDPTGGWYEVGVDFDDNGQLRDLSDFRLSVTNKEMQDGPVTAGVVSICLWNKRLEFQW